MKNMQTKQKNLVKNDVRNKNFAQNSIFKKNSQKALICWKICRQNNIFNFLDFEHVALWPILEFFLLNFYKRSL